MAQLVLLPQCHSLPLAREQETVSANGISITHHSLFYRPDALSARNQQRQSTEGKHG